MENACVCPLHPWVPVCLPALVSKRFFSLGSTAAHSFMSSDPALMQLLVGLPSHTHIHWNLSLRVLVKCLFSSSTLLLARLFFFYVFGPSARHLRGTHHIAVQWIAQPSAQSFVLPPSLFVVNFSWNKATNERMNKRMDERSCETKKFSFLPFLPHELKRLAVSTYYTPTPTPTPTPLFGPLQLRGLASAHK